MKNILIILLIAFSTLSNAQNSDKLTLKGGVMLGVPDRNEVFVNTIRRGQCFDCLPQMEKRLNFLPTANLNLGLEYTPFYKKFANNNIFGFFTGVDLMLISSRYEYEGKRAYFEDVKGTYNIYSVVVAIPVGIKFSLEQYKIEIALNARINMYKNTVDFVVYNENEPFLIYDRSQNNESVRAYLTHGVSLKYSLNEKLKMLLAIDSPFFNMYKNLPNDFPTEVHIGNVYPYLYHQISLGVTYQLLSHKNKSVERKPWYPNY